MDTTSSRLSYLSMTGIDDLEVVKSDLSIVDSSLNAVSGNVATNTEDINDINETIITLDGKISSLDTSMNLIESNISVIESDIITNTSNIATNTSNITSNTTTITNLQTDLSAEEIVRANADTTLQGNIDTEASTRASADTSLQSNIDVEQTARIAGDALKVNKSGDTMTGFLTSTKLRSNEFEPSTFTADYLNYISMRSSTNLQNWLRFRGGGGNPVGETGIMFGRYDNNNYLMRNAGGVLKINWSNTNVSTTRSSVGATASGTEIFALTSSGNLSLTGDLTVSNPNEIYYKGETLDARFHSLDTDYYTEAESDARFVKVAGDDMTGNLDITGSNIGLDIHSSNGGNTHIGGRLPKNYLSSVEGTQIRSYNGTSHSTIADFFDTGISLYKDTDITGNLEITGNATINNAHVGEWSANSSFACVSHETKNTTAGYALLQSSNGATYINSNSGSELSLRQGNSPRLDINSSGNVDIANNLDVGGSVVVVHTATSKNFKTHGDYPLITQIHSFIQPDLNTLDQGVFMLHATPYDANANNPVLGMKTAVPIIPYALTISSDGDSETPTDFTFQVRAHNNSQNVANLTTGNTTVKGIASVVNLEENDADMVLFTSVGVILPDYSWGLYLSSMSPNGFNCEIIVKVHFYQGGLAIA